MGRGYLASKTMTFRMPRVLFSPKAMAVSPLILSKRGRGKERSCPKWGSSHRLRVHHGTREEDGPVTREVLTSPRLHRGRPSTRGTEVAADGGEEVAAKLRLASASEP